MKQVLLVVPPQADAPNAVRVAIERAAAIGAGLLAVAVLDPETMERVSEKLANVGFVGEKVSDTVLETLAREQRSQADDSLRQIAERAAAAGVTVTAMIEEGDPSEICGRLIRTHEVSFAVLVAEKRSWLTRFLSRTADVHPPMLAGCEVRVMDD